MSRFAINENVKEFFKLENFEHEFHNAITPKSCGGGEEFKLLALLGDRVLNLEMYYILTGSGINTSGTLTQYLQNYVHNNHILNGIGKNLHLDEIMIPVDSNHEISKKELAECVEALIGAHYNTHEHGSHKEIIRNLYEMMKENKQEIVKNPKGQVLELFQKEGLTLPNYNTTLFGGTDNDPEFKCMLSGNFKGRRFTIMGDIAKTKKGAEIDVSKKFLAMFHQFL